MSGAGKMRCGVKESGPALCWLRDCRGWQSKDTNGKDSAIVWLGHQRCTQPGWGARLPLLVLLTPLSPWNHCWQCWVEGTHGTCFAIPSWPLPVIPCTWQAGSPLSHTRTMMPFGWKSRDTAVALPSLGDQLGHLACVSPHCCLLPLRVREAPWGGLGRQAGAGHCSETMLLAWIIDREMCQLAAGPPPHCPHTPRSGTVAGLGHPGEPGLAQNCLGIPWHGNSWYIWTAPA